MRAHRDGIRDDNAWHRSADYRQHAALLVARSLQCSAPAGCVAALGKQWLEYWLREAQAVKELTAAAGKNEGCMHADKAVAMQMSPLV